MRNTLSNYLTAIVFICLLIACKKTTVTPAYKIENGVIGIIATNGTRFGADPNNDKAFYYKRYKNNQSLSNFSALNKDQTIFYLIKTDSIGRKFIDEIDTKTGNIVGSFPLNIAFSNMVYDEVNNRLIGIVSIGSSSCTIYGFDLNNKSMSVLGSFSMGNFFIFPGKSFMRGGLLYVASISDLFIIDLNNQTIKNVAIIGNTQDVEYDVINDCLYYLVNTGSVIEVGKYDFTTRRTSVLMNIQEVQSIVQSSMCFKAKSNEIVYYTFNLKRHTISLNDLTVESVNTKMSFTGCQNIHNNVEISKTDIEY